jgi:hypothetical protein
VAQGLRRERLEGIGKARLGLIEERELFRRRLAFLGQLRFEARLVCAAGFAAHA